MINIGDVKMNKLTHVHRPKHAKKFHRTNTFRCLMENYALPVLIIGGGALLLYTVLYRVIVSIYAIVY